jgi:hypothetical protein
MDSGAPRRYSAPTCTRLEVPLGGGAIHRLIGSGGRAQSPTLKPPSRGGLGFIGDVMFEAKKYDLLPLDN